MPRLYNLRNYYPRETARIDRSTPFGNPFLIGRDGNREEVINKYRRWLNEPEQIMLRTRIRHELKGRDLVCWCWPKPCHGDVLLEIANS